MQSVLYHLKGNLVSYTISMSMIQFILSFIVVFGKYLFEEKYSFFFIQLTFKKLHYSEFKSNSFATKLDQTKLSTMNNNGATLV